jgi:hypothetical protein
MRVFTIRNGTVGLGARVELLRLQGAGVEIKAIVIGESGRGRSLGVLPVEGTPVIPCPNRGKTMRATRCDICCIEIGLEGKSDSQCAHPDRGEVLHRLMSATLGTTRSGAPKLIATDDDSDDSGAIIVFRTEPGFRGGSSHTGDRAGWRCSQYGCTGSGTEKEPPDACPVCGAGSQYTFQAPEPVFADWPGKDLVRGYVAQGAAGRAGGGAQFISVMPRGVVFRTSYGGRLYGKPSSHYYLFNGKEVLSATWDERIISDVF